MATQRDPLIKAEDDKDAGEEMTDEEKAEKAKAEKAAAKAAKSDDLSEDDLQKSMARLEEIAAEGDEPTRKQELLVKAQSEELSKAERDELYALMGPDAAPDASLADEATAGLAGGNEVMAKNLDVSEFLQEHNTELIKAITVLADRVEGIDSRQHEFNLILAKAVANEGKMIHKMGERLGVIESQPAHAPKSKGVTPLRKSFGGGGDPQDPTGELSKAEVMGGLEDMMEKSVEAGNGGVAHGVDLAVAVSKFESFNQISPTLLKQVQAHIASSGAAIH